MTDKPSAQERDIPPLCLDCRSLHKKYGSHLCDKRRARRLRLELLRALPLLGRFVPAWECDLRKYETVEDMEQEAGQ